MGQSTIQAATRRVETSRRPNCPEQILALRANIRALFRFRVQTNAYEIVRLNGNSEFYIIGAMKLQRIDAKKQRKRRRGGRATSRRKQGDRVERDAPVGKGCRDAARRGRSGGESPLPAERVLSRFKAYSDTGVVI